MPQVGEIQARLTISCPGRRAAPLRRYTAEPKHKIAKTTPCKVEWAPARSARAACVRGTRRKMVRRHGPNLISSRSSLGDRQRPRGIEGMVDQLLYFPDERQGIGQFGVDIEGGFVAPAPVNPEKPRVALGRKGIDEWAVRLIFADVGNLFRQRRPHGRLLTFPRVKPGNDDELHAFPLSGVQPGREMRWRAPRDRP